MKKILLVEDNELFALDVKMKLDEAFGDEFEILHCSSAAEARLVINRYQADLMLIDVILEDEQSGIMLAKLAEKSQIPVIFMTAFEREDLFKLALDANPYNYLQKPFTLKILKNAIELVLSRINKRAENKKRSLPFVLLKGKKGILKKIALIDIILLEAFGNYCHIHTADERYTHRMTLKTYAELVGEEYFIRIQRNYVININHLESIDRRKKLVIVAGKEYPFGQHYKVDLIRKFSRI